MLGMEAGQRIDLDEGRATGTVHSDIDAARIATLQRAVSREGQCLYRGPEV